MKSILLLTLAPAASIAPVALRARAGFLKSMTMKLQITQIIGLSVLVLLPVSGSGGVPTTRQQTVRPLAIPADTQQISPSNVPLYRLYVDVYPSAGAEAVRRHASRQSGPWPYRRTRSRFPRATSPYTGSMATVRGSWGPAWMRAGSST